jgi:RNA-directed DNA polymerase
MGMSKAMRQMPAATGRAGVAHGEAGRKAASDEASGPLHEHPGTGSAKPKVGAGTLLEVALTRENLLAAWKRVEANKGAAGVDGLDIEQTAQLLRTTWPPARQALLAGTYRPQPVRRVMINRVDHRVLRPAGGTPTRMTSNSRTARCGPACRVVWQGCLL